MLSRSGKCSRLFEFLCKFLDGRAFATSETVLGGPKAPPINAISQHIEITSQPKRGRASLRWVCSYLTRNHIVTISHAVGCAVPNNASSP
jgi:hypothetical protein